MACHDNLDLHRFALTFDANQLRPYVRRVPATLVLVLEASVGLLPQVLDKCILVVRVAMRHAEANVSGMAEVRRAWDTRDCVA